MTIEELRADYKLTHQMPGRVMNWPTTEQLEAEHRVDVAIPILLDMAEAGYYMVAHAIDSPEIIHRLPAYDWDKAAAALAALPGKGEAPEKGSA